MKRLYYFCCDLHQGPKDHPANDATPGWLDQWKAIPEPKVQGGDMLERRQFTLRQIRNGAMRETREVLHCVYRVCGNHDPSALCPAYIVRGDTVFLHGDIGDPGIVRLLEPYVIPFVGKLERWWPDVDVKVSRMMQRLFQCGREVHDRYWCYVVVLARFAKSLGCKQVVAGHLHVAFGAMYDDVRVIFGGCCCNGRLDFIPVWVVE